MATILPEVSPQKPEEILKNMGTAFREQMTLVTVTQAFFPFVVHLYGGTSVLTPLETSTSALARILANVSRVVERGSPKSDLWNHREDSRGEDVKTAALK